jgi:hypothetical protein
MMHLVIRISRNDVQGDVNIRLHHPKLFYGAGLGIAVGSMDMLRRG